MKMYRLCWRFGRTTGSGKPMPEDEAFVLVDSRNEQYGAGTHWLELEDCPEGEQKELYWLTEYERVEGGVIFSTRDKNGKPLYFEVTDEQLRQPAFAA